MSINAVYLGPVFESAAHGYDTSDYTKIDARLGTNEDFTEVCKALHENGIKIILDGVFNHVGREHFAFKDVKLNRERSRYCGWFCNLNFGGNTAYNDGFWYEGWNNCYDLVKLNLRNNEVVEYLLNAVKMWIETWDIDGIRFDAADCLDNDFIKRIHSFTRSMKPDFWLMGEIIHGDYRRWANPEMFMLDSDRKPTKVAGCPPDDFSPTGQLWGNPLYDWDYMDKNNYKWWIKRVQYSAKLFDLTRIDHFRGFESFYAIPVGDKTAEHGEWLQGPSMKLFSAIKADLGDVKLVAEDLGFLTDEVKAMLKAAGYPGMNVLEFGFGGEDSSYLPHNYVKNSVVYIGTHDNETALGWYLAQDKAGKKRIRKYLGLDKSASDSKVVRELIRCAYASVSENCVIQMQDWLCLDNSARMNIPSTIGGGNWAWRMDKDACTKELAKAMKKMAKTYFRKAHKGE